MSRQDKATTEKNARILREQVKIPENKVCGDCKRNDPRWASWNLGIFLCIRCSGIHRGMGTHISKIKSIDLDSWTPEQMQSIQRWGNRRANLYWEAHLKPGHIPPDHKMESFIRSKYESRRWALDGPLPEDPSVLDDESVVPAEPQRQQIQQAPPIHSSNTVSQSPVKAVTAQQPRGHHRLLSTAITDQNTQISLTAPQVEQTTVPPDNDLFNLDFHPPATVSTPDQPFQPKKDVKQDILSLFSAPTAPPSHTLPLASGQPLMSIAQPSPWDALSTSQVPQVANTTSMLGSTGMGQWGVSSGWAPQAGFPPAPNVWGANQQQSAVANPTNIWASANQGASAPGVTPRKQDDVFGDLWGGFK